MQVSHKQHRTSKTIGNHSVNTSVYKPGFSEKPGLYMRLTKDFRRGAALLRPHHGVLWFLVFLLMGCASSNATPTPEIQITVFVPTPAPSNTPKPKPVQLPSTPTLPPKALANVAAVAAISSTNPITLNNNGPASLVVTNEFVNVRKGPDVRYEFLGRLDKGAQAKVIGKSGDALWWQIEFAGDTGWVINDYVQANPAAQAAKVVAVQPLPTEVPTAVQIVDIAPPVATSQPTAAVTAAPTPIPGPTDDGCASGNPDWRGNDPSYPFCVRHDLEWRNGDSSGDRPTLFWDIYGVQSIELRIEGFSRGGGRYPVEFGGQFIVNKKELSLSGCGKAELYVTRKDGRVVGYNEKYFCG